MMRAGLKNLLARKIIQGGSTITQQLVRNAILGDNSRTVTRKLIEACLALLLERRLTKEGILEAYLNVAPFGHGIYGIKLASLYYFSKDIKDLTAEDSAYLAGMLKGPRHFCFCCNPTRASRRAKYVLDRMSRNGYVHRKETQIIPRKRFRPRHGVQSLCPLTTPYFTDYVRQWLHRCCSESFPKDKLIVRTGLNVGCQEVLEKVCRDAKHEGFDGRLACIIQDAKTGLVRAISGGIDYGIQPFNVAVNGKVQPASTLKPFVLAAALQTGIAADKCYTSRPLEVLLPNKQVWNVRNYQKVYRGEISLAEALIFSDNSVFAQLILELGVEPVSRLFRKLGLESSHLSPAAAIGAISGGVSPMQICSSYSAFSNGGLFLTPSPVVCVHKESGETLLSQPTTFQPAIHPEIARTIQKILRDVVLRGTGFMSIDGQNIHAKTGTTNEGSWYMSFDPSFRVLTWVESTEDERASEYPEKAVTARNLAQRIWALLRSASFGSAQMYGIFRGFNPRSVQDIIWLEEQFT